MKIFNQMFENKKKEMTIEAFDTIVESKKEQVEEFIKNNKHEVAIATGVAAGLVILGCLKMRQPRVTQERITIIVNNYR